MEIYNVLMDFFSFLCYNSYTMNTFEEKVFDGFDNEVRLYYCGKRLHNYSHRFGPYAGDKYLLYYIREGKAKLRIGDEESLLVGEGFFVNFPQSQTVYECVEGVPWSIKWIMVDGATVEKYLSFLGVTRERPFLPLSNGKKIEDIFDEMYELFDKNTLDSKIYCVSLLHKLFARLTEKKQSVSNQNEYIQTAWKLIEQNFSNPDFCVATLAKAVGFNPNYFSVLFKKFTGKPLVRALCDYRLERACKTLKFTNRTIKDVALSCGFSDELYFSRVFRKKYGIPPTEYRDREGYLT